MTANLPTDDINAAVARSADRLARGMVDVLGHDATLGERVEIERFVAGCVAWAAQPDEAALPTRRPLLAEQVLHVVATWDARFAAEAAAWQLTLAALEIAQIGEAPRRAAAGRG